MTLVKVKDFDPQYSEALGDKNIIHYSNESTSKD